MTTLGSVCKFLNGGTPSKAVPEYFEGDIPWITSADISGPVADFARSFITDEAVKNSAVNKVAAGAVLLVTRTGVGKVAVAANALCFSQDITALLPDESRLEASYLVHFLRTKKEYFLGLARGATIQGITRNVVSDLAIPLPPIPEQRRIAAILDQADAVRAKRREALLQLDSLAQAIFVEMFGDPVSNPKAWPAVSLGALVHSASDGPHVSPTYAESGVPFLSARHVRPCEISWHDMKYLTRSEAEVQWKKCKPTRDDILYTKGGTTGFAAIVNTDIEFAVWVHIALLKPNKAVVNSKWLEAMLNSKYCYRQSQDLTHGIANRDLGLKRMVNILMYCPPLELQNTFAIRIQCVEALKANHLAALQELDRLFSSLQHLAFIGML